MKRVVWEGDVEDARHSGSENLCQIYSPSMLKGAFRRVRQEIKVYRFVLIDPRRPKKAKWLLKFVFVYILSPIDLIPDFVPILGCLDEIILLPGLLLVVRRLIPREVITDGRGRVQAELEEGPSIGYRPPLCQRVPLALRAARWSLPDLTKPKNRRANSPIRSGCLRRMASVGISSRPIPNALAPARMKFDAFC